jgi:transposase
LSTKIHAMVDALGNPLAFLLTAGQAHDLEGADTLLPQMQADTLLAIRPSMQICVSSSLCLRQEKRP